MNYTNIIQAGFLDKQTIKDMMLTALETDSAAFTVSREEYERGSEEWWDRYLSPYVMGYTTKMYFAVDSFNKKLGMIGTIKNTKEKMKHVASIVWFWVVPEKRGTGLGKKLLHYAVDTLEQDITLRKINLTVASTQERAISMYESLGFAIAGMQKEEIKIGDNYFDFLIMEKFI